MTSNETFFVTHLETYFKRPVFTFRVILQVNGSVVVETLSAVTELER